MVTAVRPLAVAYIQLQDRIADLVAGLDEDEASVMVPACPAWSVRDVLAHLTGICADVRAGNIEGATTESWTAAQVRQRKERSVGGILDEWRRLGPWMASVLDDFPAFSGRQLLADATIHEHDLRGALRRPGDRDSEAVRGATEFLLTEIVHAGAIDLGLALEVRAGADRWTVGSGGEAASSVTVEPFELFRAITGRRSASQIRAYEWADDPEAHLPLFGLDPFTTRGTDLVE